MKKYRYKGFSLFEIMIVLVILIIVIGIGYPFWSSAVSSAQKTTTLSHLRQLAQCVFLYTTHNEGQLPSGYVKDSQGGIETSGLIPKAAVFPPKSTGYSSNDESHWSSQIFPYAKQKEIYTAPGFLEKWGNQNLVAFTYNGILHDYSLLQISEPSAVPVFWCGLGKVALSGKAYTNPYLVTQSLSSQRNIQSSTKAMNAITKQAKYKDPGVDAWCAAGSDLAKHDHLGCSYQSFWIYGKSSPVVFLDGSARCVKSDKLGIDYDSNGIPISVTQKRNILEFFKPK